MDHGVAIRTNRSKISDRIYDVLVTDLRKGYEVVNVNEPDSDLAIHCLEIETAGQAPAAVVGDATAPSLGVSFVCVDRHLQRRAFDQGALARAFIGKEDRTLGAQF